MNFFTLNGSSAGQQPFLCTRSDPKLSLFVFEDSIGNALFAEFKLTLKDFQNLIALRVSISSSGELTRTLWTFFFHEE